MIKFDRVSETYPGGQQALQQVDFHIEPGEMAFLTGHSGAGKSTILKLISLMERPSVGNVLINGHNLNNIKLNQVPYIRRDIGMIFQSHQLLMDKTVFDNVALPLVIEGYSRKQIQKRVSAALDMVGLLHKIQQLPLALSGGEQQMLAIGRALMTNPKLLILDEATEGLAPIIRTQIWDCLATLKAEGQSILIIDKNVKAIARLADHHYILDKGRVVWNGDSRTLLATKGLTERYLGV